MIGWSPGIHSDTQGFSPNQSWDTTSILFQRKSYAISEDSTPRGICVHEDGLRFYTVGTQNDNIYEYSIGEQFDISTGTYTTNSLAIATETAPTAIKLGASGTKLYITGTSTDDIREYQLSYPWDLSTAVYSRLFDPTTITGGAGTLSFEFNESGTIIYILGDDDTIYQGSLSDPWNVTTITDASKTLDLSSESGNVVDFTIGDSGTKLYTVDSVGVALFQYALTTAYDLATASYASITFDLSNETTTPTGIDFSYDGNDVYIMDSAGVLYQYKAGAKEFMVKYFLVNENFNYLVDENNRKLVWESKRP